MEKRKLTHIDKKNKPAMVDVSDKLVTKRTATAMGVVKLGKEIVSQMKDQEVLTAKGPVFQTAIIAGTQAVKKTSEIIPFCHPIMIDSIKFEVDKTSEDEVTITCKVETMGKTGVEMEALTGVSAAALTVYDMCKAISHQIILTDIKLVEKTGGKADYKMA